MKTPWFPVSTKPVRVGVYERQFAGVDAFFQNWNGKFWGFYNITPRRAAAGKDSESSFQRGTWRGLTRAGK